ncbi:hypothetical protein ACFW9D_24510 [Streptomyces sp. NPDC059524]|uniref:hypothetical protein n=1 Tax=Streptomyces sp. NPDC059524 TaxID=3346856 RepID=UPI00368B9E06
MGFHMHLKAVVVEQPPQDFDALAELFAAAYDRGFPTDEIEDLIHKDFFQIDTLCKAASPDEAGELVIFGGAPVHPPAGSPEPPFVVLDPDGVRAAAAFLASSSFERLWEAGGAAVAERWGRPEDEIRSAFESHVTGLRDTYGRAAALGLAMAKHFSF